MKRVGIGAAVTVAILLAVLLVAPSFVDWTDYRTAFADRIASATGRSVAIEGDVSLSILPRPALTMGKVRVGSIPGARTDDFLFAEAVDVNLALAPLIAGQLKFVSINIIAPVINAELLPDGRASWLMDSSISNKGSQEQESAETEFDLAVDRMSVSNGVVIYREELSGIEYQVTGINADLAAQSIKGPYAVNGQAAVDGKRWVYELSVGVVSEVRPSSMSLSVAGPENSVTGKFTGQFSVDESQLSGSGRLSISGPNGAMVLGEMGLVKEDLDLPKPLRQPFEVGSHLNFSGTTISFEEIEVDVGGLTAGGAGSFKVGAQSQFDLSLRSRRLDLASWLETKSSLPVRGDSKRSAFGFGNAHAQESAPPAMFSLPENLAGNIDLRVDLIAWRGQVMRNAGLAASLSNAELTLTDFNIELPGSSIVRLTGFVNEAAGKPTLDLVGEVSSRNLRALLSWIDVEPDTRVVPPSRLSALSISSRVTGSPDLLKLEDLEVVLDTTRLTGFASYQPGAPRRIDIDLAISQFDLDSYLPALRDRLSVSSDRDAADAIPEEQSADEFDGEASIDLKALDADITLSVETLTAAGNIMRGFRLDAALESGAIKITNASVNDLSGASLMLSGNVTDPLGQFELSDFSIDFETEDFSRTARSLALNAPVIPVLSGPVALQGQLSGSLAALTVDINSRVSDFEVTLVGQVNSLLASPSFALESTVRHPDYTEMMTGLGVRLPESVQPLSAVSMTGSIKGGADATYETEFAFQSDDNALAWRGLVQQSADHFSVQGELDVERAELDRFFPPDPTEELTRASRGRSSNGSGAVSGRWSDASFDLSMLEGIEATVDVAATYVSARGLIVEQLTAPIKVSNGTVDIAGWQGQVYGGPATGDIRISTANALSVETRIEVKDALIGQMGSAFSTDSTASGKASLAGVFAAEGGSQRELVSSLAGRGAFSATGLDANGAGQGAFATAALAPVRAMSQLSGFLGGGVTKGFATMGAQFSGENGVFTLTDATLNSNVYSGSFTGTIDLPRWWIQSDGRVRLEANLITQLLGNRLQMPSLIPISINGSLDAPNVKMDTGGNTDAQSQSAEPAALPAAPLEQTKPNPLDLFQGILNEIAKPQ